MISSGKSVYRIYISSHQGKISVRGENNHGLFGLGLGSTHLPKITRSILKSRGHRRKQESSQREVRMLSITLSYTASLAQSPISPRDPKRNGQDKQRSCTGAPWWIKTLRSRWVWEQRRGELAVPREHPFLIEGNGTKGSSITKLVQGVEETGYKDRRRIEFTETSSEAPPVVRILMISRRWIFSSQKSFVSVICLVVSSPEIPEWLIAPADHQARRRTWVYRS